MLYVGDMSPTGFGTVTMDLGRRLISRGLDMRFISQNDMEAGLPEPFASRTLSMTSLISVVNSMTGEGGVSGARELNSLFGDASKSKLINGEPWGDWHPDATILLGDIQNARFQIATNPDLTSVRSLHYCPVEGVDLPKTLATDLWAVSQPVAMSNFGADEIAKVTGKRPAVVYHGVDTQTFHPVKPSKPLTFRFDNGQSQRLTSKAECKLFWAAWFGVKVPPVWMLRTDRHMPRKRYNSMLRSLVPVLAQNPNAMVIVHCSSTDQGGSLPDTISKLPGAVEVEMRKTHNSDLPLPQGYALFRRDYPQIVLTNLSNLKREQLVSLYNAADLYLSTSAEGFGLTIAEALACGVPAVGLDYSAVPEVIGPAGVVVPPAYLFDNEYDHFWAAVNEQYFAEAVHALLNDPAQREAMGRKGPRHVRANFSWDTAASQFADLLQASALEEAA